MIRFAQASDREQLKALWAEVFGDSPEAVDAYFALRHRDDGMLVYAEGETIGGMLSMLPLTLRSGNAAYPASYVYAVATAPALRNRGIAGTLMERASEVMRARGDAAAVLVPASPSLFGYYEKRGYRTAFSLDVAEYPADALPAYPAGGAFSSCSTKEYARLRDAAFSASGLYAQWDERAVDYAVRTLEGGVTQLTLGDGVGCAAWEREAEHVLVRELALDGIEVKDALAILHRALGAPMYKVRLMEGTAPGVSPTPFGMIRWFIPVPALTGAPPYLSLALD